MWIAIGIGIALVLLLTIILLRRRSNSSPISIVLFRPSPRRLTEADVRGAYRRALGKEPELQKIPIPDGLTNGFLLMSDELPPMAIIDSTRGYMEPEEAQTVANRFEHPVARAAIREHKAWVSVDAMGITPSQLKGDDRAMVYTLLGKVAAEFYDDQCLLLYLPAEGRVAQPGPTVESQLKQGGVAALFGDDSLQAPMFQVTKDDPQVNAAIAEARRRLPEFLGEFERRGTVCTPMFKASFPTGESDNEYIWLSLTDINDAGLTGTIENPPINPSIPAKGSTVSIPLDRVVDWAYLDDKENPVGLFVDRVLMKRGH